jgi:uncharacterized Zn-binding protein involved in type VI secretion
MSGTITGVTATGQVGLIIQYSMVNLAGVEGTGQVGAATTESDPTIPVLGVSATGEVGLVSEEIGANILVGATGSCQPGNLALNSGAPMGVKAIGEVGVLSHTLENTVSIMGVEAIGHVGTLLTEIGSFIVGVEGVGETGLLSFYPVILGVSAFGQTGNLSKEINFGIGIGVTSVGLVGNLSGDLPPFSGTVTASVNTMSGLVIGAMGLINSTSSHGGVIVTSCSITTANNRLIARVGDMHSCPIHGHGVTAILTGSDSIFVEGKAVVVLNYSVTGCGATIDGNGAT